MLRVLGRANSVNVQKVMWLIAELDLDVERVNVGGAFGGNDTDDYLAKNPNGRVPTLIDGDTVIWESNSIVRYIADAYGAAPWWPATPQGRGIANQWMDWYLTNMHPPMTAVFWALVRTPPDQVDPDALTAAVSEAAKFWAIYDRQLAESPYIMGDALTVGDIPSACSCYRWFTMDVPDRPHFPHLEAYFHRLRERPTYREHVMIPLS